MRRIGLKRGGAAKDGYTRPQAEAELRIATTQRYADYAPSAREAEMVAAAFTRDNNLGTNRSEPDVISDDPTRVGEPDPT